MPASLHGGVATPRRRLAVLSALAGVAGVAVGTVLLFGGTPEPEPPPPLPAARGAAAPGDAKPAGENVVVSVVGKVGSPGVVTVPGGSRVADALRAAGGVAAGTDLRDINLARRLVDGEQLYVGIPAPPGISAPTPAQAGAGAPAGKLDLNSATTNQLDTLPGVGAVTAQRIVDWRTQHGRFTAVEQLREVDGIGETRFSRLREQVSVS